MQALDAGSLGDLISTFTVSCVHADSLSKNEAMARAIDGLNQGNFDWETEVSLIGIDKPLRMAMNIPKVIVMPLAPIIISEAHLKINMDISSHTESETTIDSKTEVSGSASVGIGFFKASMSVKASVGVHSSNKRSTDQRSSCEAEITMVQGETPEGLSRLMDAALTVVDKGTEMNLKLIDIEAEKVRNQVTATDGTDDTPTDDTVDNSFASDDTTENSDTEL